MMAIFSATISKYNKTILIRHRLRFLLTQRTICSIVLFLVLAPNHSLAKSRRPISDFEVREKKNLCYADIESGMWGGRCKSSMVAKENCALRCLSPACYQLVYEGDPLEEGEKDIFRSQEYKYCMHKKKSALLTSWSNSNPGRRYNSCKSCKFFSWVDPPMCGRAKQIIPGLLRNINNMDYEIEMQQKIINKLQTEAKEMELKMELLMKKKSKPMLQYIILIICCIVIAVMWVRAHEENEDKAILE